MNEPLVCCIMLTKNRPRMAARAVAAFRAQTYVQKKLVVIDTSPTPIDVEGPHVTILSNPTSTATIGSLRNTGNTYAAKGLAEQPDILVHWDDDDYSHPQRLAEQVALLQSSGADVVGYNTMLFWDTTSHIKCSHCGWRGRSGAIKCDKCRCTQFEPTEGLAWLYTASRNNNRPVGTSLMYWRHVWQQHQFADLPKPGVATAEDTLFLAGLRAVAVSSVPDENVRMLPQGFWAADVSPRMIASIHGGNTSMSYQWIEQDTNWVRVPAWDDYARKAMAL